MQPSICIKTLAQHCHQFLGLWCLMFNVTFNNISAILWQSVLLVEGTGVPGKTTNPSHVTDNLYNIMPYRVHLAWAGFELATFVVIGTDSIGSYKPNYHTIMAKMVPCQFLKSKGNLIFNKCWQTCMLSQFHSMQIVL